MFCSHCGSQNDTNSRFCAGCGSAVNEQNETIDTNDTENTISEPEAVPQFAEPETEAIPAAPVIMAASEPAPMLFELQESASKNKSRAKFIIAPIAAVLVAAIVCAFIFWPYILRTFSANGYVDLATRNMERLSQSERNQRNRIVWGDLSDINGLRVELNDLDAFDAGSLRAALEVFGTEDWMYIGGEVDINGDAFAVQWLTDIAEGLSILGATGLNPIEIPLNMPELDMADLGVMAWLGELLEELADADDLQDVLRYLGVSNSTLRRNFRHRGNATIEGIDGSLRQYTTTITGQDLADIINDILAGDVLRDIMENMGMDNLEINAILLGAHGAMSMFGDMLPSIQYNIYINSRHRAVARSFTVDLGNMLSSIASVAGPVLPGPIPNAAFSITSGYNGTTRLTDGRFVNISVTADGETANIIGMSNFNETDNGFTQTLSLDFVGGGADMNMSLTAGVNDTVLMVAIDASVQSIQLLSVNLLGTFNTSNGLVIGINSLNWNIDGDVGTLPLDLVVTLRQFERPTIEGTPRTGDIDIFAEIEESFERWLEATGAGNMLGSLFSPFPAVPTATRPGGAWFEDDVVMVADGQEVTFFSDGTFYTITIGDFNLRGYYGINQTTREITVVYDFSYFVDQLTLLVDDGLVDLADAIEVLDWLIFEYGEPLTGTFSEDFVEMNFYGVEFLLYGQEIYAPGNGGTTGNGTTGNGGTTTTGFSGTFDAADNGTEASITFIGSNFTVTVNDDEIGFPITFGGTFTFNNNEIRLIISVESMIDAVLEMIPLLMGDEWESMIALLGDDFIDEIVDMVMDDIWDDVAGEFENLRLVYNPANGTLSDDGEVAFTRR